MRVAAFFDVDGTLVPPPSLERRFLRYLRWRGEIQASNYLRWAVKLLLELHRQDAGVPDGVALAIARNKAYLAGVHCATMDAWLAWMSRHPVERHAEALCRMDWHAREGHRIFLVSGTLRPLAQAVARLLPVPVEVCATELESSGGRWTGEVRGEAICGAAKARTVERLAAGRCLDLARSFAYGDSYGDRWMLARVGNPGVVQTPYLSSWRLARLARRRGWAILRWGFQQQEEAKIKRGDEEYAEKRGVRVA